MIPHSNAPDWMHARAARLAAHAPTYQRRALGRTPITNRTTYGWSVACACGWRHQSNESKRWATQCWRRHVRESLATEGA